MASSMASRFEVPRFDGERKFFEVWRARVKDLLTLQGLSKALWSEEKPAKVVDDDEWEEMRAQACATIRFCLSDEIVHSVMNETSPREILDKLAERFMPKPEKPSLLHLRVRFQILKMKEGADLTEHINTLNQLVADLAEAGEEIGDGEVADCLLCSLPKSYQDFVTGLWRRKDADTLTVEEIVALAHDEKRELSAVPSL